MIGIITTPKELLCTPRWQAKKIGRVDLREKTKHAPTAVHGPYLAMSLRFK